MAAIARPSFERRPSLRPASPAPAPPRPQLRLVAGGCAANRPDPTVFRRRRLAALLLTVVLVLAAGALARAVAGGLASGPPPAAEAPAVGSYAGATAQAGTTASAIVALPAVDLAPLVDQDQYVVRPGDTLWSIAGRLHPGGDVRKEVDRLIELNGAVALRVGDTIRLE